MRSTGTQSPALWGAFTGDWFDRGSIGSASGYNLRTAGVVAGFDRKVTRNSFAGIAFGYDNAYQKFDAFDANDRIDVFRSMLYGGMKRGDVYADGYVGYTKNWHQTRRDNLAGTPAQSKYDDDMLSLGFEVGHKLPLITPSIGLHWIHLSSPSVTETGAGDANLHVESARYNSLRMPVGAKVSRDFHFSGSRELRSRSGVVLTPELRAYYVREFADASVRATTSFSNARAVSFMSDSGNWGRNSARLGAGLGAQLSERINFRLDYDYEVFDHTAMRQ